MSRRRSFSISPFSVFALSLGFVGAFGFSAARAHAKASHHQAADPKAEKAGVAKGAAAKEVTLEGEMMCARCSLHETKTCQSVLVVKDVKYYFTDNAVAHENVEKVCGGGSKHAIVTGVVSEEGGKRQIAPSSVKLP